MIQPYATHRLHRSQAHWTCVMVVTAQQQHVQMLQGLVCERKRFHIEWARDDRLAIHLAQRLNPELVLVDARLNGDRAPLLRRHLVRTLPHASFVLCHERGLRLLGSACANSMYWDEVPMLLRHWDARPSDSIPTSPSQEVA